MELRALGKMKPRDILIHILLYLIGVLVMPCGVVFTINAHIGAGGYDALNFALGDFLHISTSLAIYMTALLVVLLAAVLRHSFPNLLTFIASFFMGLATDFWKWALSGVQAEGFAEGLLFTVIGMVIVAFSVAAYVISIFPSNPTDDFVVALTEKGVRLGIAKIGLDVVCVLLAWLLGGEIGVGTILVTFGLGLLVDLFHKLWMSALKKLKVAQIK